MTVLVHKRFSLYFLFFSLIYKQTNRILSLKMFHIPKVKMTCVTRSAYRVLQMDQKP